MSFRIQSGAALSAAFLGFVASSVMLLSATAWGQGIPGQSVNIIGPTPDIDYMLPDTGLKQQDEVHCSVRPGDSLVAFCGYNDYRTTELTDDAWVGSSMTRDGGLTWMSRVNPGWPLYNVGAGPIGHDFAADPTTVAVPGLVLYNFIAADRGKKGTGGLFLQRWFESDKENGFPYLPSQDTTLITKGTSCPQCSGRFIDKPHMIATLASPGSGRAPVNVSGTLEDGTTKSVTVPAGELHVVYSVFTGSKQDGSKILHSVSTDWGTTWSVDSKITESVGVNQSAHLVANGNKLLVVWRRFDDTNESNALMFSNSFDRGQTWAPPAVLQELACPYDQPTANNMFRTTVHPVAATDGSKYFVFWSQRGMDGAIGTTPEYQCQFGLSRIVMSTSTDGVTWSTPVAVEADEAPVAGGNYGKGHQFMPSVAAANGVLQLAWYDTRDSLLQIHNEGVMDVLFPESDTLRYGLIGKQTVDVRGLQISGGVPLSASTQISTYPVVPAPFLGEGKGMQVAYNFINARMFAGGKVPFMGDYISVAARSSKLDPSGNWVNNQAPGGLDPELFYTAWTDNRDSRGDRWGNLSDTGITTYTPSSANIPPKATLDLEPGSEADPSYRTWQCDAFGTTDRTRDQNVYATTIKPGAILTLPTQSKRLGFLQRGFVVGVENTNRRDAQDFTICIDGQPGDNTGDTGMTGLASFSQFPAPINGFGLGTAIEPVTTLNISVPAQSNSAQSVYVTSLNDTFPHIPVSAYKGTFQCDATRGELVSTVIINGDILARDLEDPNADPIVACEPGTVDPITGFLCKPTDVTPISIADYEIHDPEIINYIWALYHVDAESYGDYEINSAFQQALVINPLIMTRDAYGNPLIMTRDVTNPLIMTRDGTANPLIMTRDSTSNPLIMTRDSTTNPLIMTRGDTTNPLIMTSGKTTNPLIMTKDGSVNPLIMTRDDTANPLIMTRNDATNPLIMTRDINQNPLIMTRDEIGNPLIMTRDQFMNPLIMTRDGDGTRVMIPAGIFTGPLPEGYVEVTWLVENDGNTVTAYNAMPLVAGGDLLDSGGNLIPSQLIVTKPYLTYASRDCVPGMQVQNQIILNSVNPFQKNKDGSWSVDKGKATFLSAPGEETTVTLRVFDPTFNPRRLGFTVQSASCDSDKLNCTSEPLAAIEVDITPPSAPAITNGIPSPLDYLPAEGPEGAFAEWLATSTDDDGSSAAVSCVASFGDQTVDVFFDETAGTFSAVFPIGVLNTDESYTATTVTCTATDLTGNSSSAGFEVLVLDKTPPVLAAIILVPEPEATSGAGAVVNFELSATDFGVVFDLAPDTTSCSAIESGVDFPRTIAPVSAGDTFPVGHWTVTCTGQDRYGNLASTSFTVWVKDTTPPSLVLPTVTIVEEASGPNGDQVDFAVSAYDLVSGFLPVLCTATDSNDANVELGAVTSGDTFPLGDWTVTCGAIDLARNPRSGFFTAKVQDTTLPVFEPVLADLTADTTGLTATVSFTPVARDYAFGSTVNVVDTAVDITCSYGAVDGDLATFTTLTGVGGAFSHNFPVGATQVSCSATDDSGNVFVDTFSVTVSDSGLPELTVPLSITGEATGPDGAAIYFAASATDVVSGSLVAECSIPNPDAGGSPVSVLVDEDPLSATYLQFYEVFPLGTTSVTCTATDGAGNQGVATFDVTVADTTVPVLTVLGAPAETVEATSAAGAPITFSIDVVEVVTAGLAATCTESDLEVVSGDTFGLGPHTVSCSARDGAGLTGVAGFSFEVKDTTNPVLSLVAPTNLSPEASSAAGAWVSYSVTAADWGGVSAVSLSCTTGSGVTLPTGENVSAQFALGSTTVTCTARDSSLFTLPVTGTFTVAVEDRTDPLLTLTPPAATYEATSAAGALVTYSVYATDAVSDPVLECKTGAGTILSTGTVTSPAVSTQFALGTTTVTCTATDGSGRPPVTAGFSVSVVDTQAPTLSVPDDISVGADSANGTVVDYSVTAIDVDEVSDVTLSCNTGSGAALSTGDNASELFALGVTQVSCTATDGSGNAATGTFTVSVEYAFIGLDLPNGMSITGGNGDTRLDLGETALGTFSRSIPLQWKYSDTAAVAMASGAADPVARVERFGKKVDGSCDFANASIDAQDSGNSAMRYSASSQSWKFSWKPSSGAGCYGVTIRSSLTGQSNGPYLFELR